MKLPPGTSAKHAHRPLPRARMGPLVLLLMSAMMAAEAMMATAARAASSTTLPMYVTPRLLPDVEFEDGHGAKRHLADFRGRVVLLNLWATWCAPCRAEMPTLDRLQARLGGKEFEVVALSLDQGGVPVVKRFFDEIGVHALGVYVDRAMQAQAALGALGVPTTLLIDRQGREVARKAGAAAWDSPEVVTVIQQVVARSAR